MLLLLFRSLVRTITAMPHCYAVPASKNSYALHTAATSINKGSLDRNSWIIDSGAFDHIACNLRDFVDWTRLPTPIPITLGNQSSIHATCIGTVVLKLPDSKHALTLENVLYAPDFGCNLLSVGKLTTSNTYSMTFGGGVCQIVDKAGTAMASCKKVGGMYKLHCSVIDKSTFALAAASTSSNASNHANAAIHGNSSKPATAPLPLHVWHRRLGHLKK